MYVLQNLSSIQYIENVIIKISWRSYQLVY